MRVEVGQLQARLAWQQNAMPSAVTVTKGVSVESMLPIVLHVHPIGCTCEQRCVVDEARWMSSPLQRRSWDITAFMHKVHRAQCTGVSEEQQPQLCHR